VFVGWFTLFFVFLVRFLKYRSHLEFLFRLTVANLVLIDQQKQQPYIINIIKQHHRYMRTANVIYKKL